jgi:endonuclease G
MRNLFLLVFSLFFAGQTLAWEQRNPFPEAHCAIHAPWGAPKANKPNTSNVCREGYYISHDNDNKIPVWGAWQVRHDRVNGCWPRTNAFVADQSLSGRSARPDDYAGTGYDKGHLANDAHQTWAQMPSYESFLMSNMYPQLPGLNRGIWKLLETATGAWAFDRKTTLIVYAGAIYDNTDPVIGKGVRIPKGFYKILVDKNTNETLAFIFPHREDLGSDLAKVQTTVANIERFAGITFPLPAGVNRDAKIALWPIDFKTVAEDKKKVCKR